MTFAGLFNLVVRNVRGSRTQAAFAVAGIVVGTAMLCFFVALGQGLRERVLNRIFPANQLEFERRSVRVLGMEGELGQARLDDARVAQVGAIDGVARAFGKQKSSYPARFWGGKSLVGYNFYTEGFFDGLPPALLAAELRGREEESGRVARTGKRRKPRCDVDIDCPAGMRCDAGQCAVVVWSERFADGEVVLRCAADSDCVDGGCVDGLCRRACEPGQGADDCGAGQRCQMLDCARLAAEGIEEKVRGRLAGEQEGEPLPGCPAAICVQTCERDADCAAGERCGSSARLGGDARVCAPAPCKLGHRDHQRTLEPDQARGEQLAPCREIGEDRDGLCPTGSACPDRTYCAADNPATTSGRCERPIPAVLNPLLLEAFNTDMAGALGLARIATTDALYGVGFHVRMGDSFFSQDAALKSQHIRQAQIVGFSPKAPELGLTVPLRLVQHYNRRYGGEDVAGAYDAVVVETASNEVVPAVIAAAERLGFALSRRSRVARTFGTVVFIVHLALVLLAIVVLAVSAISMAQTFALLVHERRREIAVLRSIGASRLDIAALVLGEALALGLVGGLLGAGAALGGATIVDVAAATWLAELPLVPDTFFVWPVWLLPTAVVVAALFAVLGAAGPGRRATRLDPAQVLSQG
jgi:hypothetical protein